MNLPDRLFGKSTSESYERVLAEPDKPPAGKPKTGPEIGDDKNLGSYLQTPKNYILLPQTNEHPDLLVAKNRLAHNAEVEKAGEKLGLNLQNNNQGYIGNINWEQALKLNKELGNFTLNPKLFAEFLKLLKSGKAFNGEGNQVSSGELEQILNEIVEVRNPWRSEWLDSKYVKQGGILGIGSKLAVTYNKFDSSGNLVDVPEILDPDTLMQTKTPGINSDDWRDNPNSQGLPRSNIKDGSLYYWPPIEGRVAWFGADAGGAVLGCDGYPLDSDADLGVRGAKIFGGK
ncbi:hypothetical protein HYX16_02800 [Candidatus Woesearchaeota archaeon]|nr:hypothetical protein [Candidatus Woesearchaeota archaeon]